LRPGDGAAAALARFSLGFAPAAAAIRLPGEYSAGGGGSAVPPEARRPGVSDDGEPADARSDTARLSGSIALA
jgi:hypothetical protein